MANKETWAQAFEALHGRKPTPDEFMKAKADGFPVVDESLDEVSLEQEVTISADDGAEGEQVAEVLASEETVDQENGSQNQEGQDKPSQSLDTKDQTPHQNPMPNPYLKANRRKNNLVFNLILPIVAMLLGLFFTILAWASFFSVIFTFFALVTFVVAIVAMALSLRSSRKALSIIAVVLTGLFLVTSIGGTVYQVVRWIAENPVVFDSDDYNQAQEYIDSDYQFDWTDQEFKDLKVKETSLEEVLASHGNATDARWYNGGRELTLSYRNQDNGMENVMLTFVAEEGDKYLLKSADSSFESDQVKTSENTVSSWSKADFDALKLGTNEDLLKGTRLSEVLDTHPDVTFAHYELSWTLDGDLVQNITISYYDFGKSGDQLTSVSLSFRYDTREDAYFLVNKY